jgi:tRNA A-37 threonylcarbamoyl transferase component Bud32
VTRAYDPIRAENALHGEKLVATVRLALLVFRFVIMTSWSMSQPVPPEPGTIRMVALPAYFVFSVGALVALRRAKSTAAWLPWLPHVMNAVDYAFIAAMALPARELDPAANREILAMSCAIILSFSIAREGAAQTVVSLVLACATYLFGASFLRNDSSVVVAFVLGSFVASSTLALRVIVGLQRRAMEATRLGQYTLTEKLGEGGMGEVYKATHAMLRRPTAVKLLREEGSSRRNKKKSAGLARFEREVQLTARLSHPNTIAIYDYGRTPDGIFYYAMEYLDGANLEQLVDEHGAQPPARVVHILSQICGSLAEAHGIGLIHRDIKPANIALCERGGAGDVVKVLDFGLVKKLDSNSNLGVTNENVLTGTPLYLSPEAIVSPEKVSAQSDLYAVGCVGYFLLTGKHVFEGKTLVEICSHHLHTKPVRPGRRIDASLPSDLEDVVLACLAKEPADRPADAHALMTMLDACECAGEWTDADAREWWAKNRTSVQRLRAARPVDSNERSLAVDLERA